MGTLSRLISHLKKNKFVILEAQDLVSSKKNLKKIKTKKIKLINSLAKSISLKEMNLIQYELKTGTKQFISLAELITAISINSSLEILDLSHNALTPDISLALIKVINAQCVPLKQLSLSYLLNVETVDLNNVIKAIKDKNSLTTLNLYGNELPSSTCYELEKLIINSKNTFNELNLSRCVILSADLLRLKEVCEQKDKKFTLITDKILLYDSLESSPSILKEHSSLKDIEALSKPNASSKRLYSSGSEGILTSSYSNSLFFASSKENLEVTQKEPIILPTQGKDKQNNYAFALSFK